MEVATSIRNDFFAIDLENHGGLMSHKIALEAQKHTNDKKWVVRQAFALKKQINQMQGDKHSFDGRVSTLVTKILKTVPEEHKNNYSELKLEITKSIS